MPITKHKRSGKTWTQTSIRLPVETWNELFRIAQEEDGTVAGIIRRAIKKEIER